MVEAYGALAFNFGLVDDNQKEFIELQCKSVVESIDMKDFMAAFKVS